MEKKEEPATEPQKDAGSAPVETKEPENTGGKPGIESPFQGNSLVKSAVSEQRAVQSGVKSSFSARQLNKEFGKARTDTATLRVHKYSRKKKNRQLA